MKKYILKYRHPLLKGWHKFGEAEGESFREVERITKRVLASVHKWKESDIDVQAFRIDGQWINPDRREKAR